MDILFKKPSGSRGRVRRALTKRVYIIRKNPNSSTLQKATMQIGKWPHFRILGVNYATLLAQERQGFVFVSPKKA